MRRAIATAAVAALTLVGVALAASNQPKHDFKPAEQALAKAIALKLADLPGGFKATPSSSSGDTPHCKGFNPNQSDLTVNGKATSPTFAGPGGVPSISSSVDVFTSSAQAQTAYSRVVQPALPGCLASIIAASESGSTKYVPVSAKLAPLSGFGQQAALVRVVQDIVQGKTKTPLVVDFVVIHKGRVDVLFTSTSLQQPYSGETTLVTKLASRMP